ncbi:carbohydrate porin [Asticcacaulis sp. 201]|uniref:carbohydrate porin n=1 Tax=Asticcacaulis sp. 201 TaxID=3028787 RepID=UPI002916DCC8|nr:carbohydrate porin [Asticcacaulis sp. 201]MDV6331201.1 carbohydrate porin [Asticcacaulis sp. 201]
MGRAFSIATVIYGLTVPVSSHAAEPTPPALAFGAIWTGHLLDNVGGGVKTGTALLSDLELTSTWTGENGWSAYGDLQAVQGRGFSGNYSGDLQMVSNIDLLTGTHLGELWLRKSALADQLTTTVGLINLNDVFDVQDAGALFLNASHGFGYDFAQSGASAKPLPALGLIEEWHVSETLRLRLGVFDAVGGDPDRPGSFVAVKLRRSEGLQYQFEVESDFKGGYVKIGHWENTVAADMIDESGQTRRPSGTYGQVLVTLIPKGEEEDVGLRGWLRAGVADDKLFSVGDYLGGGLIYNGPLHGRDQDTIGVAIASVGFSRAYRATHEMATRETSLEITYAYEVKPGVVLQPDVQYIVHPSGDLALHNALVLGLNCRISLGSP